MIMKNIQTEETDSNSRYFLRILKSAGNLWTKYDENRQTKIARGLLGAGDTARTADLSYNDERHQLNLELRIEPSNSPDIVKERLVLSQDHWANLLASVTFEKEDNIVRVCAKTILDPAQNPACAVKAVFEDIKRILIDPLFQQIVY
jgi:hypothetical protein